MGIRRTVLVWLIALAASCTTARPPDVSRCDGWRVVKVPAPVGRDSFLAGVSARTAADAWAVGVSTRTGTRAVPLIEHWDGARWSIVPTPPLPQDAFLNGVAAVGANDAWAVGMRRDATGRARTMIEHWDGTRWTMMPSPNLGVDDNSLNAISAASPNDVWAVGDYVQGHVHRALVEHWTGRAWNASAVPNIGTAGGGLSGVAAVSHHHVWAVGGSGDFGSATRPLIARWNGVRWRIADGPVANYRGSSLSGIAATPARAWAVGGQRSLRGDRTLAEGLDAGRWRVLSGPAVGIVSADLESVAVRPPDEVWAVGATFDGKRQYPLIERLSGRSWRRVASPNPANSGEARLAAVDITVDGDAWAVGDYARSGGVIAPLVERVCR